MDVSMNKTLQKTKQKNVYVYVLGTVARTAIIPYIYIYIYYRCDDSGERQFFLSEKKIFAREYNTYIYIYIYIYIRIPYFFLPLAWLVPYYIVECIEFLHHVFFLNSSSSSSCLFLFFCNYYLFRGHFFTCFVRTHSSKSYNIISYNNNKI
jgi:hypothetical protein